ncbi:protein RIC-3-like [Myxocyprinus asiaticus]|uniref:protein RIC-3-like n=1 Tax=Myxocyprinus asiaticus TaxID=70543 RepID=UPI0022237DE1|nr:protein RIC-3-like [Myxocyprinus asiaticus]
MAISTCQKITFISCSVLCMSLFLPKMFLPRGKKEIVHSEVGPGHFPPLRQSHSFSRDQDHWDTGSHYIKHYNPEVIARAKGASKPNLLGQFIPVYGFGIFLYIIYLFFKLTSKDKPPRKRCRFPIMQPEYTFQEMPTCQLVQLQARMSEQVREKRMSKVVQPSSRSRRGTQKREERKLKQLREITHMMWERQLQEGVSPEEEAEEAPHSADWEGSPEETYPEYDMPCRRRRYPSVILEEADQVILTAEELAERMEKEEGEDENESGDNDLCTIENMVKDVINGIKEEGEKDDNEQEDEEEEEEEKYDEEEEDDEEETGEDQPCLPKSIDENDERLKCLGEREEKQKASSKRRQITFSDHRYVYHYPKGGAVGCKYEEEEEEEHEEGEEAEEAEEEGDEGNEEEEIGDDEDCEEEEEEGDQWNEEGQSDKEEKEEDPLMEAESLGFNDDVECDPEEQEVDLFDFLQTYQPEVTVAQDCGTLRMHHNKQKVKK